MRVEILPQEENDDCEEAIQKIDNSDKTFIQMYNSKSSVLIGDFNSFFANPKNETCGMVTSCELQRKSLLPIKPYDSITIGGSHPWQINFKPNKP